MSGKLHLICMKTFGSVFMQIRCNFPDISNLSETLKNNFQFLTLKALGIFFTRLALLAEYFFPILYKIGTFLCSALHVKVNFGSKTYDSRS